MNLSTGWCPSCTCGWHKPLDAFDVTPPETECRNPQCQCHEGFWDSVGRDTMAGQMRELGKAAHKAGEAIMDSLPESLKRYAYGDR